MHHCHFSWKFSFEEVANFHSKSRPTRCHLWKTFRYSVTTVLIETALVASIWSTIQVNLCQKLLFLHQLTHNMMADCSLNCKNNFCTQHFLPHVLQKEELLMLVVFWSELVRIGQNWSELVRIVQNWSETIGIDPNWT